MTHPASIFPISALAVSAILLLSSCSQVPKAIEPSASGDERLVTKSVVALVAEMTAGEASTEGTVRLR
ncbi:MAG: hypothetical protein AAFU53_07635 [Cyanobacteria bacterium J06632_3]